MERALRRLAWGALLGLAVAAALASAPRARAQLVPGAEGPALDDPFVGTLFWKGEDGVPRPALALGTDVTLRVSGLVARATVRQRFANETDLWLEGVYVFPLPEMAAVDRMVLTVGERRIEGVVRERAEAKRSFRKAKREGRTASLLEQERPNLFTTSVANIGPGERVDIAIEYQQTLRYDAGGFELRFPMTLTARYVPGAPAAEGEAAEASQSLPAVAGTGWAPPTAEVPDAPRITPPMLHPDSGIVNPLTLRVALEAGFPLAELASPTHAVDVAELGGHAVEVAVRDVPVDRDFVLRWRPERGQEPRAAIFSEAYGGEHYALVMVLPPAEGATGARIPRETVFVIDTSGSMGGASIGQAKAALHQALDLLQPDDAFNVIAFDNRPTPLFDGSRPVSWASLRHAHEFVDGLRAGGGTEMRAALEAALRDPGGGDASGLQGRLRQVVLVTDASIGNEESLFATIRQELGRSRLFPVGIGSAPNAFFLSRAAALGRGTTTLIGDPTEVKDRMAELFAKIESPVLRDLRIGWSDDVEMWPAQVPDLYAGEPVLVAARLPRFVGDVVVTGRRGDRPYEVRLPLTQGAPERGLHKLWAREKIAHWMMQRSTGTDPKQIREEVLKVALAHQLVSKFTSLVAVDVTPRRPASAPGAGTNVPNMGPAGFDPSLVPGVLPQTATPAGLLARLGFASLLAAAGLWGAERRRRRAATCAG